MHPTAKAALTAIAAAAILFGSPRAAPATDGDPTPTPAPVYAEYDRAFRELLGEATAAVGKEVIKVERLSEEFTVPQKLTIKGTPYEIGLTIGHIGRRAGTALPMVATECDRDLNPKVVELYNRIYPQYLEVVRGMAAACGEPAEKVAVGVVEYNFTTLMWCGLLQYERFYREAGFEAASGASSGGNAGSGAARSAAGEHCSVVSYWSAGRHLVGRNFDNPTDRPHYFTVMEMAGTYKVMAHTIYGITSWAVDGINEKGLSLCVASNNEGKYASHEPYPREPAVLLAHMLQIVMQTCATVDEALALLRTVRVWLPVEGNHVLLADPAGKAVIVEWKPDDHGLAVFDKPGAYEILTNAPFQEGEDHLLKTCWRYRRTKPLAEAGIDGPAAMLDIMNGMRITTGPGRTLWTSIMDLNARTFEVHYFKEFDRKYEFGF